MNRKRLCLKAIPKINMRSHVWASTEPLSMLDTVVLLTVSFECTVFFEFCWGLNCPPSLKVEEAVKATIYFLSLSVSHHAEQSTATWLRSSVSCHRWALWQTLLFLALYLLSCTYFILFHCFLSNYIELKCHWKWRKNCTVQSKFSYIHCSLFFLFMNRSHTAQDKCRFFFSSS